MKIKLLISYDGSEFGGWQRQNTRTDTVQQEIENALEKIFLQPVSVMASGRTDAGVHALGQVAHFKVPNNIDIKKYKIIRALNSLTHEAIVVKKAWAAPDDFHSIGNSQQKIYKYLIWNSPIPTSLRRKYTTWVKWPLDLEVLNKMSRELVGQHDFKSFQTGGTEVKTTIRRIDVAEWRKIEKNLIEFTIAGSGFLKQMVRNIVGTQLDLHSSDAPELKMRDILQAKNRSKAEGTAPPQGLYLYRVIYPSDLDNECREL